MKERGRDMDPQDRSLRASLAAHTSWANTVDPASRTAKARAAANGRFEKAARELHPDATDEQIEEADAALYHVLDHPENVA